MAEKLWFLFSMLYTLFSINWSKIHLGIKLWVVWKSLLSGQLKNIHKFYSSCFEFQKMGENKLSKVLLDTLYGILLWLILILKGFILFLFLITASTLLPKIATIMSGVKAISSIFNNFSKPLIMTQPIEEEKINLFQE